MDRLDAMNVLLAVVDEGSISAGARRLRAPLATVSRKVADLESHLRTSLLVRTSRRIELTDVGREFVAAARRIIEQLDEAEQVAAGEYREPRGELLFTLPVSFGQWEVLPIVIDFMKEHPLIDLQLQFSDRKANLMEDHIHVALRIGDIDDQTLIATRVGAVSLVTCASPAYLAARGTPRTPEELAGHDGISMVGWRFEENGAAVTGKPRDRVSLNTEDSALAVALAGVGIARILRSHVQPYLDSGTLVEVLADYALPPVPVHLIYPQRGMMPLKLRAFLNFLAPRLRARLSR
jgi:DNA-binding transcriptional LysR family regulator